MNKRVVITGIGVVSPIGTGAEAFFASLREGKNGIKRISSFDTSAQKVKVAAEIPDFDPFLYMDKKEARRMDRFCQMAMAAAHLCMEDSGLNLEDCDMDRFGVFIGSGVGGLASIEREHTRLTEGGPNKVSPLMVPMIIGNMAAGNISIRYGLKGSTSCIVTACSTGASCIGEAFRMIKHGYAARMLAGGTEAAITPLAIAGFANLTALTQSDDINRASIPFDRERSGFVMGEGAGIMLLESYEAAVARGARIYAEIKGYGATSDGYHMTAPSPEGEGAAKAMALALAEGGVKPSEVDYINAHGTSTPHNDRTETMAIKTVFGQDCKIPVSSSKSMFGHLLGAAGAVEGIVAVLAIAKGFIPPTINYKEKDPECDLDYVPNVGRDQVINCAISNSLGFGGHNVTLLFGKV